MTISISEVFEGLVFLKYAPVAIICLKKWTYLICFINLSKSVSSISITVLVGMPTIKTIQFLLLHLVHICLNLGLY